MTTPRARKSAAARQGAATRKRRADPKVKAEQQSQIVKLYVAGASIDEIAQVTRLSPSTVHAVRRQALADALPRRDKIVEELREQELQRLDRLQRAHWSAATGGNVGSSRIVLKCIDMRAKLLGLHAPVKVDARVRSELDAQIEALVEELGGLGVSARID